MQSSTITRILTALAYNSPVLFVSLIGMIIAFVLIKKHPKVSMLAIVGFLILSLSTVVSVALSFYFGSQISSGNWSIKEYDTLSRILAIGTGLFRTLGYVFLTVAIFIGRLPKTPDREYAPPPEAN